MDFFNRRGSWILAGLWLLTGGPRPALAAPAAKETASVVDFPVAALRAVKEVDNAVAEFVTEQPPKLSHAQRRDRAAVAINATLARLKAAGMQQSELTKALARGYLLYSIEAANYMDALSQNQPAKETLSAEESMAAFQKKSMETMVPVVRSKQICGQMVELLRDQVLSNPATGKLRLSHQERERVAKTLREIDPFSVWRYGFSQEKAFRCGYQNLWHVVVSSTSTDGKEATLDLSADSTVVADSFDALVAMQESQEAYSILRSVNDAVKVDSATISQMWDLASTAIRMSRDSFKSPSKYIPQLREYYAKRPAWSSLLESLGTFVQASDLLLERTSSIYQSAASGPSPKEGHRMIQKHLAELPAEFKTIDENAQRLLAAALRAIPELSARERKEVTRYAMARWSKDPQGTTTAGLDLTTLIAKFQTALRG